MNLAAAEAIAQAVLYEGYILYPYRSSATKNRQRWTFGRIFPRKFAARTGSDPCTMQTQCLVRGRAPVIGIKIRFLHAVERELGALAKPAAELPANGEPAFALVPSLEIDGKRFVAWQEAVEREILAPGFAVDEWLNGHVRIPFAFSEMRQIEPLRRSDGLIAAVLLRTACTVAGELTIAAEPVGRDVFRLTARIENITACESSEIADRNCAQRRAFASTHTIFAVRSGTFVSLMDPPKALKEAAAGCENQGTWPVLVGEAGQTDLLSSSPIILYDYPQIAPESPGDFFDGTEIDEMLALRTMTKTDEEKREMAATDLRTRELLERTEAMMPAELGRLHGALRSPRDLGGDTLTHPALRAGSPLSRSAGEGAERSEAGEGNAADDTRQPADVGGAASGPRGPNASFYYSGPLPSWPCRCRRRHGGAGCERDPDGGTVGGRVPELFSARAGVGWIARSGLQSALPMPGACQ